MTQCSEWIIFKLSAMYKSYSVWDSRMNLFHVERKLTFFFHFHFFIGLWRHRLHWFCLFYFTSFIIFSFQLPNIPGCLILVFKAPCYYNPRRVVFVFSGLKCGQLGGRVSWLWWAGHSDCLTPIGCRRIGGWSTPGENRQVARPPNIQELQQCSLNRIS